MNEWDNFCVLVCFQNENEEVLLTIVDFSRIDTIFRVHKQIKGDVLTFQLTKELNSSSRSTSFGQKKNKRKKKFFPLISHFGFLYT